MSEKYTPLYRKYRPINFSEVIGQENIVKALSNAIKLEKIAHAYLFCGPRGTGKTSLARILAKSLNCKNGPTLKPCETCASCVDIKNGIPTDVIEIDAASNRSVEDTQNILEKIQYVPVNGKFKIYIIDEVHMLSNHAFNALLKTLEEPPKNVIFILATTEIHKVLDTIISRCQKFDFRRITTNDIVNHLKLICEKENIKITDGAILNIAKSSQGGLRDALALLDQISILSTTKTIEEKDIDELLGKVSFEILNDFTTSIMETNTQEALILLDKVVNKGNEPLNIITNLIQHFRNLLVIKSCDDINLLTDLTQIETENLATIKKQVDNFEKNKLLNIISRLSYYSKEIKETSNRFLWLELALIEISSRIQIQTDDELIKRIENLENAVKSVKIEINPPHSTDFEPIKPKFIQEINKQNLKEESEKISQEFEKEIVEKLVEEKSKTIDKQEPELKETAIPKVIVEQIQSETTKEILPLSQNTQKKIEDKTKNIDIKTLWVSILQSIESASVKAWFTGLAHPVEITQNHVVIAFTKDIFIKKFQDNNIKTALENAIKQYLNVKEINIRAVLKGNVEQQPIKPAQKEFIEKSVEKEPEPLEKEEDEYAQSIIEKTMPIQKEYSDQTKMIVELFDGKNID